VISLIKYFFLICLLIGFNAKGQITSQSSNKAEVKSTSRNPSIKVETAPATEQENKNNKKDKQNEDDKKVERFVMPFTRWVEGKLQKSSVINPTAKQVKKSKSKTSQHTLRTAIKQALATQPGTVLSADKVKTEDGLVFKIKILSKDGVVRIVTVPSIGNKE